MKRVPDVLITARRLNHNGLLVYITSTSDKEDATIFFGTEDKEEFDDACFERAKEDIAATIVSKFMEDTGKPFDELDIVVAFHAPEFDNIEFELRPPEDQTQSENT